MKKFLILTLISSAVISTATQAQGSNQAAAQPQAKEAVKSPAATPTPAPGSDDAAMLQQAKERQKGPMMEKTGLTDAQASRVIEINFEIRQAARGLRDLDETERRTRVAELKVLKEKKYSEIPLTPEQIKTVYTYYEDMGKANAPKGN
jgi:Spy/CpxP family protein refolding chaperone